MLRGGHKKPAVPQPSFTTSVKSMAKRVHLGTNTLATTTIVPSNVKQTKPSFNTLSLKAKAQRVIAPSAPPPPPSVITSNNLHKDKPTLSKARRVVINVPKEEKEEQKISHDKTNHPVNTVQSQPQGLFDFDAPSWTDFSTPYYQMRRQIIESILLNNVTEIEALPGSSLSDAMQEESTSWFNTVHPEHETRENIPSYPLLSSPINNPTLFENDVISLKDRSSLFKPVRVPQTRNAHGTSSSSAIHPLSSQTDDLEHHEQSHHTPQYKDAISLTSTPVSSPLPPDSMALHLEERVPNGSPHPINLNKLIYPSIDNTELRSRLGLKQVIVETKTAPKKKPVQEKDLKRLLSEHNQRIRKK